MLIAIVLGVWTLVSIIVTPAIGYFLFVMGQRGNASKRTAADTRPRPVAWSYLAARPQEYVRRTGQAKSHRHEARGPRAG